MNAASQPVRLVGQRGLALTMDLQDPRGFEQRTVQGFSLSSPASAEGFCGVRRSIVALHISSNANNGQICLSIGVSVSAYDQTFGPRGPSDVGTEASLLKGKTAVIEEVAQEMQPAIRKASDSS